MVSRSRDVCSRFEDHLPDLLRLEGDGVEIPAEEAKQLLDHGATCVECGELLRTYRATVELLRALPRRNSAPKNFLSWVKEGTAKLSP